MKNLTIKVCIVRIHVPEPSTSGTTSGGSTSNLDPNVEKDNSFREFRRLCADIAEESSYTRKTQLVHNYIAWGHSGSKTSFSLTDLSSTHISLSATLFCLKTLASFLQNSIVYRLVQVLC